VSVGVNNNLSDSPWSMLGAFGIFAHLLY